MRIVNGVLAFYSYRDWPSNHYIRNFSLKGIQFNCCEAAIMYCKAMHFKDPVTGFKILAEPVPQKQKLLGRTVESYDDDEWRRVRPSYYATILRAKYGQNPDLLALLLETAPLRLAEAAERDIQWGAGLAENDDRIGDPKSWRGQNLCGATHELVRDEFLKKRSD